MRFDLRGIFRVKPNGEWGFGEVIGFARGSEVERWGLDKF